MVCISWSARLDPVRILWLHTGKTTGAAQGCQFRCSFDRYLRGWKGTESLFSKEPNQKRDQQTEQHHACDGEVELKAWAVDDDVARQAANW